MRPIVTPAIALFLCALSACGSSSSAPSTPKAVLPPYVAAALGRKSVHWTVDDYVLADGEWQISADVNRDSGTARVTWRETDGDEGGEYELVRVSGFFYVRGDAESLQRVLDLTRAQATRYAGRWISTPNVNGSRLTFGLADGLTLPSIVRQYASALRRTSARATGEPRPMKFDKEPSQVESITGGFSKWNEPVRVHAPSSSTPIAVVRRS